MGIATEEYEACNHLHAPSHRSPFIPIDDVFIYQPLYHSTSYSSLGPSFFHATVQPLFATPVKLPPSPDVDKPLETELVDLRYLDTDTL